MGDRDHVILLQILIQFIPLVAEVVLVQLVEMVQLLQTHLQVVLVVLEQQMILQEVQ
jgi:ABC-type maltose transport system permease subunit